MNELSETQVACPKPGPCEVAKKYIDRVPNFFGFLRTYSARIYFIETNSSLAILQLPHPSNPLDDNHAHSFDREHGSAQLGLEDVWFGHR